MDQRDLDYTLYAELGHLTYVDLCARIGPQPIIERVVQGGWTLVAARYVDRANCPRWDVFAVYHTPVPAAPRIPSGPNPHDDPEREARPTRGDATPMSGTIDSSGRGYCAECAAAYSKVGRSVLPGETHGDEPCDGPGCENTISPAVAREHQVYSGRISVETETVMGARFRFTPPVTVY